MTANLRAEKFLSSILPSVGLAWATRRATTAVNDAWVSRRATTIETLATIESHDANDDTNDIEPAIATDIDPATVVSDAWASRRETTTIEPATDAATDAEDLEPSERPTIRMSTIAPPIPTIIVEPTHEHWVLDAADALALAWASHR